MAEERIVRRLAAILAADVVGYSCMMSEDEAGTLATLQAHRSELIAPALERHQGRIVKLMGDGMLAQFSSAVEAVACAAEIQRELARRNRDASRKMEFRIGVHVGDVIVDKDDIYGDGVNIAARLEGIAETGGICISRQAFEQVDGKLALAFRQLGPQTLKNIAKPMDVFAIETGEPSNNLKQEIRYCRAPDGVRLAWTSVGQGPPLVRSGSWLTHLEYDWESPIRRPGLINLAKNHTLIRYDARGNGMSDWDVDELSLDTWVSDLATVVDAAGLNRSPSSSRIAPYPLWRFRARRQKTLTRGEGEAQCYGDADASGMGFG